MPLRLAGVTVPHWPGPGSMSAALAADVRVILSDDSDDRSLRLSHAATEARDSESGLALSLRLSRPG